MLQISSEHSREYLGHVYFTYTAGDIVTFDIHSKNIPEVKMYVL